MTNHNTQDMADDRTTTLKAFSRALAREVHVLIEHPDLLWQQLYNRLQWEGEEVTQAIALELAQRSTPGARPWLRLNTPYRESEALVRILEGHTGEVMVCAYSPDGRLIVSASYDNTLRVWDAASGHAHERLRVRQSLFPGEVSCDGGRVGWAPGARHGLHGRHRAKSH